jgi:serine/threonine protein phosphatase 1
VIFKSRPRKASRPRPRVPEGVRVYAIGDVHGRADLLADVFARIDADRGSFPIMKTIHVFLGDYVDRGPSSRDVIDLLIARGCKYPAIYLKGNHESFLIQFLKDPQVFVEWQPNRALPTLLSYGLVPSPNPDEQERAALASQLDQALPDSHRRFLEGLKLSFSCGDFFFVHAGVRPGIALADQREDDLLWIRDDFLLYEYPFEKVIVHGHSPVIAPDIRRNRIDIDTGAYATGKLTCLVLEGDTIRFI